MSDNLVLFAFYNNLSQFIISKRDVGQVGSTRVLNPFPNDNF